MTQSEGKKMQKKKSNVAHSNMNDPVLQTAGIPCKSKMYKSMWRWATWKQVKGFHRWPIPRRWDAISRRWLAQAHPLYEPFIIFHINLLRATCKRSLSTPKLVTGRSSSPRPTRRRKWLFGEPLASNRCLDASTLVTFWPVIGLTNQVALHFVIHLTRLKNDFFI